MDLLHFRTGCISILAEVVGAASWAARPYFRDVIDLALGILIFESSSRKVNRRPTLLFRFITNVILLCVHQDHLLARRAAAYLLFECMNRLREVLFEIASDQLLEYYRGLKQLSSDADTVVAYHAQRALGEMDKIGRAHV